MKLENQVINPPCNSLKATSFIMPDERKRNVKVVVGGEISRHIDVSGEAPTLEYPLLVNSAWYPHCSRGYCWWRGRRQLEGERTGADDESEIISVVGPQSNVGGCESEGVIFEEAVGRLGLILQAETALDTSGQPISCFSNIQMSFSCLIGFQTGQLLHPLS